MKKYLIDQAILLMVGIGIMVYIPSFCGPIFAIIFETMAAICWGYLCRRILLLPFDFLCGKVTRCVYFSTQCGIHNFEFYKGKYCPEWKFYYENKVLVLLVPAASSLGEICGMEQPKKDEKVCITYFRFSKLLLSLESV